MSPSVQHLSSRVTSFLVDLPSTQSVSLDQELEPFGSWVDDPIWVPPKDSSAAMAETMLTRTRPFTSQAKRWATVVDEHRSNFTQVRELDLNKASIRLPQGNFFVTVTEQKNFHQITDTIPDCVQTRLDEFLSGPGKRRGVKVYYLKPLCVEVGEELIMTTPDDLAAAIAKIQQEVFAEYRRQAPLRRTKAALIQAADLALAVPRSMVNYYVRRRQQVIDAYQAQLEFKRRKTALRAANAYRKCRTDGCTFDEMLELTNPIERRDVAEQYALEQDLSKAQREHLVQIAVDTLPWFMTLSLGISNLISLGIALSMTSAPPVIACDPAFVAEMPDAPGVLLKIGHFDEVGGVMHVEI